MYRQLIPKNSWLFLTFVVDDIMKKKIVLSPLRALLCWISKIAHATSRTMNVINYFKIVWIPRYISIRNLIGLELFQACWNGIGKKSYNTSYDTLPPPTPTTWVRLFHIQFVQPNISQKVLVAELILTFYTQLLISALCNLTITLIYCQ